MELLNTTEHSDDFLAEYPLGGDFYRAAGCDEIPGFQFGYLIAQREGVREAVVPYVVTDFKFNTMLDEGYLPFAKLRQRQLPRTGAVTSCDGHGFRAHDSI